MEGPEEPWNKWVKVPGCEMNEGRSGCLGQFNTDQDFPWNFLWCYLDTSAFSFIPAFALLLRYICHPTMQYQWGVKFHQPYTRHGVPGYGGRSVICGVSCRWHFLQHLTAEDLRVTNDELRHSCFLKLLFFVCLKIKWLKRPWSGLASLLSSSVQHWNMLLAKLAKII